MSALRVIADDYGIADATSRVILALLDAGRLSGTSAMTVFPEWSTAAIPLRARADADLGVHLTLTDHAPLTPMPRTAPGGRLPPFPTLARWAFTGALDLDEVARELAAQIDAFEAEVGRPPSHLDGHHHVQQLPGVRDVVLTLTGRLAPGGWVRTCRERVGTVLRRGVDVPRGLAFAAAAAPLHRALRARGVPTNAGFTGAYGFDDRLPYGERMARFLVDVVPSTAVMVHPGAVDDALRARDPLGAPREAEAAFLAGPDWPLLLERLGLGL